MSVANPFGNQLEAARYQAYRPRYHHIPFALIHDHLGRKFASSLDVACGTGHSTSALAQVSEKVVGCDLSESMLSEARNEFCLEFICTAAESLPFQEASFDFVNISMGYHWVEPLSFLREAKRVLSEDGFLAIDSYGFLGKIFNFPEKQKAHNDLFENYMPSVICRPSYPTEEDFMRAGLKLVKEFKYEHRIEFGAKDFINLVMTWSNFLALSVARKPFVAQKVKDTYEAIFEENRLPLSFGGKVALYKFF